MVGGLSEARQQFKMAATFSKERKEGNFKLKHRRNTSERDTGSTCEKDRKKETETVRRREKDRKGGK